MNYRVQKQVIVALSTLILVSVFVWGVYLFFSVIWPQGPTMPPQKSTKDVGVELEGLEVISEKFFQPRAGVYDAVALIRNPNSEYGAAEIVYEFIFEDENKVELYSGEGKTFILPEQSRYIVVPAINVDGEPQRVLFDIQSISWERLQTFSPLGLSIKNYTLSRDESGGITRFSGVVENGTPYNLQNIEIQAVLYEQSGVALAVGQTNMQTLLRGTDRSFQIMWPYILPPDLEIDARVESNFLENSNFIREFGTPQKFQEYY